MLVITTELQTNLDRYLTLAETEEILVTHHGKVVAELVSPLRDRGETADSLVGILPQTSTFEETMETVWSGSPVQ